MARSTRAVPLTLFTLAVAVSMLAPLHAGRAAGERCTGTCVTPGEVCEGYEPAVYGDDGSAGTCAYPAAPTIPEKPAFIFKPIAPRLQIEIPTLQFSTVTERETGEERSVTIPWISEYIAALYRWAVPVGAILATVVIMIAGVLWLTSSGAGQLGTAKQMIGNAVIGLLLLVGSYAILNLVNPELVNFAGIRVRIATPQRIESLEDEDEEVSATEALTLTTTSGVGIIGRKAIATELLPFLQAAARAVHDAPDPHQMIVTSGHRDIAEQRALIVKNCQNGEGSARCNPRPGRPITCMLRYGARSCPHTTGRALDIWGATADGSLCIKTQQECMSDRAACRNNPCQAAVIRAMREQRFCNLASEPWHFEKPKMSRGCSY